MKRTLIFLLVAALLHSSAGAQKSGYVFIEPNMSFAYDTTLFATATRQFKLKGVEEYTFKTAEGHPAAELLLDPVFAEGGRDPELLAANIKMMATMFLKKDPDILQQRYEYLRDSVDIWGDDSVRNINGFFCFGVAFHDKHLNKRSVLIQGLRPFENAVATVRFVIEKSQDLEEAFKRFGMLMNGVTMYAAETIRKEEADIRSMYTVVLDSAHMPYLHGKATYTGWARVKEHLKHKVAGTETKTGNVTTRHYSTDGIRAPVQVLHANPGSYTVQSSLVILNSFGKEVTVPFSFTYVSRGSK